MDRNERDRIGNDPSIPVTSKTSLLYSGSPITRALVGGIPFLGTYVDNVLTTKAQEYNQKRIDLFMVSLSEKLKELDENVIKQDDEVISDLFQSVLEKVVKTKSETKLKSFACLTSNCLLGESSWDETEAALELLNGLSEVQMAILIMASETKGYIRVTKLPLKYTSLTNVSSKLFCTDLVSKGLLQDQGVNHLDGGTMEILSSTLLTEWLLKKVSVVNHSV